MGKLAAKQGDRITGDDKHTVMLPNGATPQQPFPFNGIINGKISFNVYINGQPAATVDSTAINSPPHIPTSGAFVNPPSNQATIKMGSGTVKINGNAAARHGDLAETCSELPVPPGQVVVTTGTVNIGD
jgi:uncharacterized Zn-binding protein involved in type VI secretion